MKKSFKGTIHYSVDSSHPDIKYMDASQCKKELELTDTYSFNCYDPLTNLDGKWDINNVAGMLEYIKYDLKLVAGGGYDWKHIHNIKFTIKEL